MNIAVESSFVSPRPLDQTYLRELGVNLVKEFSLPPADASLNVRDQLFDYDLNARLFRGAGHIRVGSDKFEVRFRDLRNPTDNDIELIKGALLKAGTVLSVSESTASNVQVDFHAKLIDVDRAKYLATVLPKIGNNALQGAIFYRQVPDILPDIRVQLERSNIFEEALFFHWTGFAKTGMNESLYEAVYNGIVEDLKNFDLTFNPQ